jgi:hypothetical protein
MRANNGHRAGPLPSALAGGAVLASGLCATVLSALPINPIVGDILVFASSEVSPDQTALRVIAQRTGRPDCVLDLGTMLRAGGSLVVEARIEQPAPLFRLHWAGQQTGGEADDCGSDVNVLVEANALNRLAMAAGGYGLVPAGAYAVSD